MTLSPVASSQVISPSAPAQQDTQVSPNVSSLQPFQVEQTTEFHPFHPGQQVRPLSATEHGRVMTALHTSVNWLKKAIASLDQPSSWGTQARTLLSSLFPGGLQQSSERNALKAQLTHTLDGVQKQIDNDASTIGSATLERTVGESKRRIFPDHIGRPDEVHISNTWLRDGTDVDLAGTVMHEASHVYANTVDNWYNGKLTGSPPGFSHSTANVLSSVTDFTFTNAVNNASTVQLAVEALAEVPFEAMH